ncbi:MAG TPA: amine oxidase [Myxococcales bacterium]|nr:amine oxidase [Myxococcales bacterium]HBU48932.1 amine oxidase [Myxococcales bacterium]
MAKEYDVIIVGGGHNGLVTAAYMARAGRKVLVLERRSVLGGACVTEETFAGFKVSTAAYVNSLFRPDIIRDLRLADHGFEMLERSPSSFTPFPDGRHLFLGPDEAMTRRSIAQFSEKDAEAYPRYEAMLERVAAFIEPTIDQEPPDPQSKRLGELWKTLKLGLNFRKLGPDMEEAIRVLTAPAQVILDEWFESEELKTTLATDAIIGAMAAPSTPGTGYVLFHHVMGETNGKKGVWGYVRGGMGGLSNSIADSARAFGAEIRTDAAVERITVSKGRVSGVVLNDGTEFKARTVASNLDCNLTFNHLVGAEHLDADFHRRINRIRYDSASMKINVALSELPDFKALPGKQPGPQHRGTIHLCATTETIEKAFDDAKYGIPSSRPVLECTIPSVVDDTVAPDGKHLMNMFVQYAPYHLAEGTWEDHRDDFADRCFQIFDEYAPNFSASVLERQVLAPPDLEKMFGLTGGNIFQGEMNLFQLAPMRPVLGWANYRTPIGGLYLCGAAAHPGGGVMGACGRNAAQRMLQDGR